MMKWDVFGGECNFMFLVFKSRLYPCPPMMKANSALVLFATDTLGERSKLNIGTLHGRMSGSFWRSQADRNPQKLFA